MKEKKKSSKGRKEEGVGQTFPTDPYIAVRGSNSQHSVPFPREMERLYSTKTSLSISLHHGRSREKQKGIEKERISLPDILRCVVVPKSRRPSSIHI